MKGACLPCLEVRFPRWVAAFRVCVCFLGYDTLRHARPLRQCRRCRQHAGDLAVSKKTFEKWLQRSNRLYHRKNSEQHSASCTTLDEIYQFMRSELRISCTSREKRADGPDGGPRARGSRHAFSSGVRLLRSELPYVGQRQLPSVLNPSKKIQNHYSQK